jgi:hypothetical protein
LTTTDPELEAVSFGATARAEFARGGLRITASAAASATTLCLKGLLLLRP